MPESQEVPVSPRNQHHQVASCVVCARLVLAIAVRRLAAGRRIPVLLRSAPAGASWAPREAIPSCYGDAGRTSTIRSVVGSTITQGCTRMKRQAGLRFLPLRITNASVCDG
jgi:hypothetical protein